MQGGYGRGSVVTRRACLLEYARETDEDLYEYLFDYSNLPVGQSEALIIIERFVNRVALSSLQAYEFRRSQEGRFIPVETNVGSRLRAILPLVGLFDSRHDYAEHQHAFLDACWLIESVYGLDIKKLLGKTTMLDCQQAEALNDLVGKIRMSSSESWFLRRPSDRQYEAGYRASSIASYMREMISYYSRVMIVRVDFGYLKESLSFLTIDQAYAHLDRLLYLKDVHPMFRNLVGYSWAIEQGKINGFHIHGIFLFDGSRSCRDVHKGFEIGGLWQEITSGLGKYENCNAQKDKYRDLGIGMIHRDVPYEFANAVRVSQYLTKDTQYLRMKPAGRRVFGTGVAPDPSTKRGRPPTTHVAPYGEYPPGAWGALAGPQGPA